MLTSHEQFSLPQALTAALSFGYLLGSVPFGLLFARMAGAGDVRRIGSGNIGATNVLRTGKRGAAAATLICDAAKGAIAVIIALPFGLEPALAAAAGAFLGHLFPVWLRFRGGKGVATFIGIVAALNWKAGLMTGVIWLATAAAFRYSSLSALVAAATAPIWFAMMGSSLRSLLIGALALLIFYTHRANIARLVNGDEPRIGRASKAA